METADVAALVEELSDSIDELELSLAPLLNGSFSSTASRLPLLDKAKYYTLSTYAIESTLFSFLRANGVDAKEHAVFQELSRVKEYFANIKKAETGSLPRLMTVDKAAAARFIKHDLGTTGILDRQKATALQEAAAKRMAQPESEPYGSHDRFDSAAKRMRAAEVEQTNALAAGQSKSGAELQSDGHLEKTKSKKKDKFSRSGMSKDERKAAKRERRMQAALAKQSPSSPSQTAPPVGPPD